jgi:DNA-binding MarR family transcriptional regulator
MLKLAAQSPRPLSSGERSQELFLSMLFQTCFTVQVSLDRRFLRGGVTFQEASALLRCVKTSGITPGRLAVALARDKGKITRIVDRLVAQGLVVRDLNPPDRRFTPIKPTREGKRAARHLAALFESVRKQLFAGISDGELRRAERTLPKLHRNAIKLGGKVQKTVRRPGSKGNRREREGQGSLPARRSGADSRKGTPLENGNSVGRRKAHRLSNAQIENLFPR